jgi:predicted alpha/beta-hydrolase family hydrolase
MLDLCRVAAEVRVFLLLELSGAVSRHLDAVTSTLRERGIQVERTEVPYRFQKKATEMLVAKRPNHGTADGSVSIADSARASIDDRTTL